MDATLLCSSMTVVISSARSDSGADEGLGIAVAWQAGALLIEGNHVFDQQQPCEGVAARTRI